MKRIHGPLLQAYLPSFVPGGLAGIDDVLGYLTELGFGGLVTQPVTLTRPGSSDGPYSPVDHMQVDPGLGGEEVLYTLNQRLRDRGIVAVGDLVPNHVDETSPIVREALDGGDDSWLRTTPDAEANGWSARSNVFGLKSYHWVSQLLRFRATAFYPDQWELNLENPDVVDYMGRVAERMLDGWAYGGLRLDAIAYVIGERYRPPSRSAGSPESNPPDAVGLALVRHLKPILDHRGAFSIAEAGGSVHDMAAWLQPDGCDLAYNFAWLPAMLMAFHTRDWTPIRDLFAEEPPVAGSWIRFLGSHDEVQLRYSPHRDALVRALGGPDGEFVCFDGNGLTPRPRDLVPGARAWTAALGLTILADGVPLLFQGDAEGYSGDRRAKALDPRDPHRCRMPWDSALPGAGWPDGSPYPLEPTWRTSSVADQTADPGSSLQRTRRLIELRRTLTAVQSGERIDVDTSERDVLAFARVDERETVVVVANASDQPRVASLELGRWAGRSLRRVSMNPADYPGGEVAPRWDPRRSWVGASGANEVRVAPHALEVIEIRS